MPENKTISPYEAIKTVPDHLVAEIINGKLITHPRPAMPHTLAASELGASLIPPFKRGVGGPGGWIILDEPELKLDKQVLIPDLAGWRVERAPEITGKARSSIAPDWICEVLSPSTARFDVGEKKDIYASFKVPYLWFIDPSVQTLLAFERDGDNWQSIGYFAGNVIVNVAPFAEVPLELCWLWDRKEK